MPSFGLLPPMATLPKSMSTVLLRTVAREAFGEVAGSAGWLPARLARHLQSLLACLNGLGRPGQSGLGVLFAAFREGGTASGLRNRVVGDLAPGLPGLAPALVGSVVRVSTGGALVLHVLVPIVLVDPSLLGRRKAGAEDGSSATTGTAEPKRARAIAPAGIPPIPAGPPVAAGMAGGCCCCCNPPIAAGPLLATKPAATGAPADETAAAPAGACWANRATICSNCILKPAIYASREAM